MQIRNALSDSADTPLYIETVPRRGYRFLAPVVTKTIAAPPPRVVESQSGIQGSVSPQGTTTGTNPVQPVVTDPTAVLRTRTPVAVAPTPEAPPVVDPKPPLPKSGHLKLIAVVVVLVLLAIVAIIYVRTHKVARLIPQNVTVGVLDSKVRGLKPSSSAVGDPDEYAVQSLGG
jgi:hypothetical protein